MNGFLALAVVALALQQFVPAVVVAGAGTPCTPSAVVFEDFNEVATSTLTTPYVMAWFDELIDLNPTAVVVVTGGFMSVISATNTPLKRPAFPQPLGVIIYRE